VLLGVDEIKLCRDGDDRAFLTSRYDPDLISGCDFLHLDENHGGDRLALIVCSDGKRIIILHEKSSQLIIEKKIRMMNRMNE